MDDKYFFTVIFYLFIASLVMGFLPSSFYTGTSGGGDLDYQDYSSSVNLTADDVDGLKEQVGFFKKILTFVFVPFLINGIPLVLGTIIGFLNYLCIVVSVIWIYDKVRGIGS